MPNFVQEACLTWLCYSKCANSRAADQPQKMTAQLEGDEKFSAHSEHNTQENA
jgi:hypothetical protein